MKRYKKKPVIVEAILFDRDLAEKSLKTYPMVKDQARLTSSRSIEDNLERFYIDTLEGRMVVSDGDYIIKGVEGEFYPCKPGIFHKTYEEVAE